MTGKVFGIPRNVIIRYAQIFGEDMVMSGMVIDRIGGIHNETITAIIGDSRKAIQSIVLDHNINCIGGNMPAP